MAIFSLLFRVNLSVYSQIYSLSTFIHFAGLYARIFILLISTIPLPQRMYSLPAHRGIIHLLPGVSLFPLYLASSEACNPGDILQMGRNKSSYGAFKLRNFFSSRRSFLSCSRFFRLLRNEYGNSHCFCRPLKAALASGTAEARSKSLLRRSSSASPSPTNSQKALPKGELLSFPPERNSSKIPLPAYRKVPTPAA